MSHVDFKKYICRPVEFKKCSCHPVKFKKLPCPMSLSFQISCRMSLRPKMVLRPYTFGCTEQDGDIAPMYWIAGCQLSWNAISITSTRLSNVAHWL